MDLLSDVDQIPNYRSSLVLTPVIVTDWYQLDCNPEKEVCTQVDSAIVTHRHHSSTLLAMGGFITRQNGQQFDLVAQSTTDPRLLSLDGAWWV